MAADSCTHGPAYAPMPRFSARHNEHHHRMLPSTKAYHPRYAKMRPSSGARRKPSAVGERKPKETGKDLSFSLAYADLFRQEHHMLLRIHRSIAYAREDSSLTGPLLGCDSCFGQRVGFIVESNGPAKKEEQDKDELHGPSISHSSLWDATWRHETTRLESPPSPPSPPPPSGPRPRSQPEPSELLAAHCHLGRALGPRTRAEPAQEERAMGRSHGENFEEVAGSGTGAKNADRRNQSRIPDS